MFSVEEEGTIRGAEQVFHDFHPHFPSGALSEQPCSPQLERAGKASGAAGRPQAPWLGGGGQRWLSGSVEGRGLLKGCLVL